MKYLIGFVAFLAFLAGEGVLFTAGVKLGVGRGYQQGYSDGFESAAASEQKFRLNVVLDRMAFYESSFKNNARGDFDGTRYLAFGRYQFHRRTFMWLCRLSNNPGLDWKNSDHQRIVVAWALQHGYGYLWPNTYPRALNDYFMAVERAK